jgi:hypothetical protein
VFAFSGATGSTIHQWTGSAGDEFETGYVTQGVAFAGDLDMDGVSDLLIGADDGANGGRVHVISGRTNLPLYDVSDAASSGFGEAVAGQGDANGDGLLDVLVGAPFAAPAGALFVYSGATRPAVQSIQPDRADYRSSADVTISGAGFLQGDQLQVEIGADFATNVVIVDDATITASIGSGNPGPADVTVQNTLGSATLADGFRRTPAVLLEGMWTPGGSVTVRYLIDPGSGIVAIVGVPPRVDISTPPFLGELCISPFLILFIDPPGTVPNDELDLSGDVPNDPGLSGITVLFQALVGPVFSGRSADATWSNCASMTIQ